MEGGCLGDQLHSDPTTTPSPGTDATAADDDEDDKRPTLFVFLVW